MNTTEEPPGRKSSSSGLENREYGSGDTLCRLCDTLYPQMLALTSPTSGGRYSSLAESDHGLCFVYTIYMYIKWYCLVTFSIKSISDNVICKYVKEGAHGSLVVKALGYKLEGRGFVTQ
jgi:hypothetical protein